MSHKLSIDMCRRHGFHAICIGDDNGATRMTPSKCCGSWTTMKEWPITESMCDDFIKEFQRIRKQLKAAKEPA